MTKKSQELKKEILKNLTDWCFDPLGDLAKVELLKNRIYRDVNHFWFRLYQDDETNPNWRTEPKLDDFVLDSDDYQEVKEAMINEMKQNSQDWKIEKENDLKVIKHKSGRKHWKSSFSEGFKRGFREEEWKEIESALKNQEQNPEILSDPSSSEQQAQQEQTTKETKYMGHIYRRDNKY